MEIILKRSHNKVKKPHHVNKNIFSLYPPRHINIEPATCSSIDTEIICILPGHSHGFITSTFRGDEIKKFDAKKQRLWLEILNKSYQDNLIIAKNSVIGFLVIEPEHIPHKRAQKKKQKYRRQKRTRKKGQKRNRKRRRQYDGFLSRCNFAYAGRDTVNQAANVAPDVIKAATNDINKIAEQRINQVINQGGQELERILPNILRGAIEDVYQIPFRMFGNLGKKHLTILNEKY